MKVGDTLKCNIDGFNYSTHPQYDWSKVARKGDEFVIEKIGDDYIISTCGKVVRKNFNVFEVIKTNTNNYEIY
jgi:hypothetical protein